jgi:uncharacterized protein YuzE
MGSIKYDRQAHSIYVSLTKEKKRIAETIPMGDNRFLDVDVTGKAVGIEIILPKSAFKKIDGALALSKEIELVQ